MRGNPFKPCDTTKSGNDEINALVSHTLNKYIFSKPILDKKKKEESLTSVSTIRFSLPEL